jgi:hypothetical protein
LRLEVGNEFFGRVGILVNEVEQGVQLVRVAGEGRAEDATGHCRCCFRNQLTLASRCRFGM